MIDNYTRRYCGGDSCVTPVGCAADLPLDSPSITVEVAFEHSTPWPFLTNFQFEEESKPNRSLSYLASSGSLSGSLPDNRHACIVGGYDASSTTQGPYLSYSSEGPSNAYFVQAHQAPHILGPTEVHLPDRWDCATASYGGTSFAAPQVAGAAALIQAQYPGLSNDNILDSLIAWGTPISPIAPHLWLPTPVIAKGDVNCSGGVNSADIIYLIGYVLEGGPAPCPTASNGDVNCSGSVDQADIIYLVNYVL